METGILKRTDNLLLCKSHSYSTIFTWFIIELVDSISRDERDAPLTQYNTNDGISRAR